MKTLLSILALSSVFAFSAVPNTMLFQGSISEGGSPFTGKKKLVVKLCNATVDGLCTTSFNDSVQVSRGHYAAALNVTPATFNQSRWIEVIINGTIQGDRIPLTSAPFAMQSALADSAIRAEVAAQAVHALLADSSLKAAIAHLANRALLADSTTGGAARANVARTATTATTANGVTTNVAVTSLNGLKNDITIMGANGLTATKSGSTITISGNSGSVLNNDTIQLLKSNLKFPTGSGRVSSTYSDGTASRYSALYVDPANNEVSLGTGYSTSLSGGGSLLNLKLGKTELVNADLVLTSDGRYLQLPYSTSPLPAEDCDETSEFGRIGFYQASGSVQLTIAVCGKIPASPGIGWRINQ